MAANYWESTQRKHWQFTKEQLASIRQKLEDEDPALVQSFGLPQLRHLNIFFNQQTNRLAKRLGTRQQAIATAQVYIKRFYTKVEIRRTNPFLVMATALYLACKMEECPQHIRLVTQEARGLWTDMQLFHEPSKIGECEFWLISELNSHLIVHQPYRTLTSLQSNLNLTNDELALAWSIVNDHYMTDLPLIYPPHTIALTAILLAIVFRPSQNSGAAQGQAQSPSSSQGSGTGTAGLGTPNGQQSSQQGVDSASNAHKIERYSKVQRFGHWLSESNVDLEAMVDCTQELISFYDCHEAYNDKLTREQIVRFIKARGLDKG
ncbi:hypothetical protein M406DRAFT_88389 [Cryphonectria parasitica EP155]|uniref:RNA polymerase II holoenzyme cyclin-like subunit n=1 Tax=Cryphonectria parasitica (strain ATCC 38755 / EP155) TaxID=660469 RepID=A0A9P4Y315_CRYP1|nr:uncharacterized protein M406DRAFT_88389 [Cryphonectria parasitica EP155]KAF3765520.1 hypothetical protein M406DRAFT_88389 [Cryphonectria parasitica EP155]